MSVGPFIAELIKARKELYGNIHSVDIHALTNKELVVLEVGNDLLGKCLGTLFESGNLLSGGAFCDEIGLDSLHVSC